MHLKRNNILLHIKSVRGLVKGVPGYDDRTYGELAHKNYRGIEIRDFRNNWLGEEDFSDLTVWMDAELDAYDAICEDNPDLSFEPRFFNIFKNNEVSLKFNYYYQGQEEESIGEISHSDPNKWNVEFDSVNWKVITANNPDPNEIAGIWQELRLDAEKRSADRAKRKDALNNKNLDTLRNSLAEQVSGTEITVPVDVEVDDSRSELSSYSVDDIPSDEYILSSLSDVLPISDVNRYIKRIVVRFMLSGASISLYPKIRATRLRADSTGNSSREQFDKACKAIGRKADRYFQDMLSGLN